MFVLGKKIMDQMLTCLNHPFAAEFLQRWLLILFLVFTHVCVGGVRVLLSLVCKQAHSSSAARAHRYNCTWKPGVDIQCLPWSPFTEPKACWFLPVCSCQFALGDPSPPSWALDFLAEGMWHSCLAFMWVLGMQSLIFALTRQVPYPPSHLSGPYLLPLIVKEKSKTRTLMLCVYWIMCFESAYGRL